MGKYNINKEFGIYCYMKTPVMPAKAAGILGSLMHPPGWIKRDPEVSVSMYRIAGYRGVPIEALVFEPRSLGPDSPCLVYYHGGGFFFGAAGYHYKLAKQYALGAGCRVVFVQYRLSPKYQFPIPAEDSYAAYLWAAEHADVLRIDKDRIAVGGDSAGGCLCAAAAQMCRDRGTAPPVFQLLIYPVTDRRMDSESNRKYTDTPMWHSRLSAKMWQGYLPHVPSENISYASPLEADRFDSLPPAYVELAEFDCLHDEGLAYAQRLMDAGVDVEVNETKGTMHGYDIAEQAATVRESVNRRIAYMNRKFAKPTAAKE